MYPVKMGTKTLLGIHNMQKNTMKREEKGELTWNSGFPAPASGSQRKEMSVDLWVCSLLLYWEPLL